MPSSDQSSLSQHVEENLTFYLFRDILTDDKFRFVNEDAARYFIALMNKNILLQRAFQPQIGGWNMLADYFKDSGLTKLATEPHFAKG